MNEERRYGARASRETISPFPKPIAGSNIDFTKEFATAPRKEHSPYFGYFIVLLSSLAISAVSIAGKYLSDEHVCPFEVTLSRMIGQLFFAFLFSVYAFFHQKNKNKNKNNSNYISGNMDTNNFINSNTNGITPIPITSISAINPNANYQSINVLNTSNSNNNSKNNISNHINNNNNNTSNSNSNTTSNSTTTITNNSNINNSSINNNNNNNNNERSLFRFYGFNKDRKIDILYLILNGVFYMLSSLFFQISFNSLNLADASVIYFTMPVWTAIIGLIFLNEHLNIYQIFGIIISLLGALMDARPGWLFGTRLGHNIDDPATLDSIFMCLAGSVCGSLCTIAARKIANEYNPFVIAMYPGIVGCIVLPFFVSTSQNVIFPFESIMIGIAFIACGIFTASSQILLNYGLKFETAAVAGIIRTSDMIFNAMWSVLIFETYDSWFSYCGIFLVFISCVIIGLDKHYRHLKNKNQKNIMKPYFNEKDSLIQK